MKSSPLKFLFTVINNNKNIKISSMATIENNESILPMGANIKFKKLEKSKINEFKLKLNL